MLEIDDLHTFIGTHPVLRGVTFRVAAGEVVALLGRNGSGKTTTIRSVLGFSRPRRGVVRLRGTPITGWSPHRIARAGVGFVPQGAPVFPSLSVDEDLRLAAADGRPSTDRALEVFPELKGLRKQRAASLSGGERQMLSIARALAADPVLLIMDEPSNGLSLPVIQRLRDTIVTSRRNGMGILISEQDLSLILAVADRALVLDRGRVIFDDTASALRASPVLRDHLGL